MAKPLFCLVGPTASGKSAVALALAPRLNAEIVSADSMQVYRGMDIGTAKPTREEQARVRHHLIDVAELCEPFDAARYCELALAALTEIRARGKTPLVVGGSGMYLRALTEGLFAGPRADPAARARWEKFSASELHERLARLDPVAAQKIAPQNKRRLIRALEVIEATGRPFSKQQTQWQRGEPSKLQTPNSSRISHSGSQEPGLKSKGLQSGSWPHRGEIGDGGWGLGASVFVGLLRSREDLSARIEARVQAMFAAGWGEEVRRLLKLGLEQNPVAMQAAGYREMAALLRGELTVMEARQRIVLRTRQLARRQLTWLRHQAKVQWVNVKPDESIESIAGKVAALLA